LKEADMTADVRQMEFSRRRFIRLAVGGLALPAVPSVAMAQPYPARPVRVIVGLAAGTSPDIVARLLAQRLSERLGQSFFVENRPGAGSNLATETIVRAPPDGYSLLLVLASNAINTALYDQLNFNFIRDIAPVAIVGGIPFVMLVNPSFPAKTVPEFIAYAKANPGKINMASVGNGTAPHVYGELFREMTGVDTVHVPYRGNPLPDLIGGQVQVYFCALPASIGFIRSGKLRALAVTTVSRLKLLPDIPTVGESVTGYEAIAWQGIGSPKNTPVGIIEKLNEQINASLADTKIKASFADMGVVPMMMTPAEFGKFIADETKKWGKVVKMANIRMD
jgi:tripartite-type tricarboxylate transporter receptor subunit TctC